MLVLLFRIYWMATIATKELIDIFTVPPKFIYHPILRHYKHIFLGGCKEDSAGHFYQCFSE